METDFSLDHIEPDEDFPQPKLYHFTQAVKTLKGCTSRPSFLASSDSQQLESLIWKEIERLSPGILSFDVFDTYLLRNNKPEALRYLEMSQYALKRLRKAFPRDSKLKHLAAEDLCLARLMGMQATYRTRPLVQGCGEGEISEVIAMQRMVLGLDEQADDILLATEIEYEADNLNENPLLARIARRFRKQGGKVILVSDMYLGAAVIEKIIRKVASDKVYDHLFSSADMVISKRSGKIFPALEKNLRTKAGRFFHFGDSWPGDVQKPRLAGWHAFYFPVSEAEKLERRKKLMAFITSMDAQGLETRTWAKL